MFNAGDRVVYTGNHKSYFHRDFIGRKATVDYTSGNQTFVLFDGDTSNWGVYTDNLELVKENKELTVDDFKIGDRVIYTGNKYPDLSPECNGRKGTVTKIRSASEINVKFDDYIERGCLPGQLEKENYMQLRLSNGSVISGTPEQVLDMARKLGVSVDESLFYNSSTHGRVLITGMGTNHIKNAMLKLYRDWAATLNSLSDKDLVKALQNGPSDKVFLNLLTEFIKRQK